MLLQRQYVLITVIAGECQTPQQRFEWGVPLPTISVGTAADWVISGEGISDVHLLLSFDGRSVRASAASDSARVEVEGKTALGVDWRILELPFELRLGTARLGGQVVGRELASAADTLPDFATCVRSEASLPMTAASGVKTQLLDLAALRVPHPEGRSPAHARHGTCAGDRSEPPFQVVSGSTLVWSFGTPRTPDASRALPRAKAEAPARPLAPMPRPSFALGSTLCDGGALRDYARQLVADAAERGGAAPAEPDAVSPPRSLARAARALRLPSSLPRMLRALPVRRRLLVMPALASLGLLPWLLGAHFAEQGSRADERARVAETPAEAPAEVSTEASDAKVAAAPTPSVSEAAPGARDIVTEAAPDPDRALPPRPASPHSKRLEQDAFRAAFGGNVEEAAALYDELAQARGEPVFAHAARLVRKNRLLEP